MDLAAGTAAHPGCSPLQVIGFLFLIANVSLPIYFISHCINSLDLSEQAGRIRLGDNHAHPGSPQQRWLQSLRDNKYLDRAWLPVKVLGQGGQGVVGLYEWDSHVEPKYPYNKIAVKQASYSAGRSGLTYENLLLELLKPTKSVHIVHKLADMTAGRGAMMLAGKADIGPVHRFILEYCEGGSLWDMIYKRRFKIPPQEFEEEEVWEIFHCLARGLLAMHHGSEDATKPRWEHNEICHFDIKCPNIWTWLTRARYDNILIGSPLDDDEHQGIKPYKFADLGSGRLCPDIPNAHFHQDLTWLGTEDWVLPEQGRDRGNRAQIRRPYLLHFPQQFDPRYFTDLSADHKNGNLVYGTASNIWQVGLVIWCLMHNEPRPNWNGGMVAYRWSADASDLLGAGGATIGDKDDQDTANGKGKPSRYSKALRVLVAECLLIQQNFRIKPDVLVAKTAMWLKETREFNRGVAEAAVLRETTDLAAGVPLPGSNMSPESADALAELERSPRDLDTIEPPLPPSPPAAGLGAQIDRKVQRDIIVQRKRARQAREARRAEAAAKAAPRIVAVDDLVEQLADLTPLNLNPAPQNRNTISSDGFDLLSSSPGGLLDDYVNIPVITFLYTQTNWFGRVSTKTFRLMNVRSNMPVHNIKRNLVIATGCPIPAKEMKFMNGRQFIPGCMTAQDLIENGLVIRISDWRNDQQNRPVAMYNR